MGQIQNSLNQLFASGIGASLAISHSPYMRGQRTIRNAGNTISSLQEVAAQSPTPMATQKELMPDIEKAYQNYEDAILQGGTAEQKKALYTNYEAGGVWEGGKDSSLPYLKYQHQWPGAGSVREAYLEAGARETGFWDDDTLKSIKKAYDAKHGVKNAVQERLSLLDRRREGDLPDEKPERRSRYL